MFLLARKEYGHNPHRNLFSDRHSRAVAHTEARDLLSEVEGSIHDRGG